MRNQDQAARRAANTELMPGDLQAADPRWRPLIEECQLQMSASGLGTPAGLDPGGELWLRHYMVASTGYVKWLLHYRFGKGRESCTLLGFFVTEYLPDRIVREQGQKPLKTHGKLVMVNQKVTGQLARPVRVLIDGDGMSVPVPEQMWAQYGLE